MRGLENLQAALSAGINAAHGEVVRRAVDALNARAAVVRCSYAAWRDRYVEAKVRMRHTLKDYERNDFFPTGARLEEKMRASSVLMGVYRRDMYVNVCGQCTHCKSRRRTWPPATVWQQPHAEINLAELLRSAQ